MEHRLVMANFRLYAFNIREPFRDHITQGLKFVVPIVLAQDKYLL